MAQVLLIIQLMKLAVTVCAGLMLLASAQDPRRPPDVLPASATRQLAVSLRVASVHPHHLWRDTPPLNNHGSVNAYVEIAKGDRRKWEFDMRANRRAIDRVIPATIGGYPVNYGFVPQTISYDGDPFDALILGPPIAGGQLIDGVTVGLMIMEDEKGLDSKVVLSRTDRDGRPLHELTAQDQRTIGDYFKRYKMGEPGKFSKVPGWDSIAEGLAWVRRTHAFFIECRDEAGSPCQVAH